VLIGLIGVITLAVGFVLGFVSKPEETPLKEPK
jgi:hypothetical protein